MTNILGNTKKNMKRDVNISQSKYVVDQQNTQFAACFKSFGDNYSLSCAFLRDEQ